MITLLQHITAGNIFSFYPIFTVCDTNSSKILNVSTWRFSIFILLMKTEKNQMIHPSCDCNVYIYMELCVPLALYFCLPVNLHRIINRFSTHWAFVQCLEETCWCTHLTKTNMLAWKKYNHLFRIFAHNAECHVLFGGYIFFCHVLRWKTSSLPR